MKNVEEILRIYKEFKSEPNAPYSITQHDRDAAALAAQYSETLLRAATVLAATCTRHKKKQPKK
jgi:hypothetical protein